MTGRKISVIIPALNEAENITALLHSLHSLRECGHEVIVVDGGSDDATVMMAEAYTDRVIDSSPGRAKQLNSGARAATGDILWFVHADCIVPEHAENMIFSALATGKSCWGHFNVRLSGRHPAYRMIESMMNLRSCLTAMATGDQAVFVERAALEQVGGFPDIELMEDIELSRRLKRSCGWPACVGERVLTSSRRWETNGIARTVLLMWWLRLAHFFGVGGKRLLCWYERGQEAVHDSALLVFARAPVPGEAKTRLIPTLGEEGSALLHERLVRMTLERITRLPAVDIQLWCTPVTTHPLFVELAKSHDVSLHTQQGDDLGSRMHTAFVSALRDHRHVVIIGTDCPGLDSNDIDQAVAALRNGHDVVLGPAEDGGYVLIGLSQSCAALFDGVEWGTSRVLEQTRSRVKQANLNLFELSPKPDLDTPADLERFPELLAQL